MYSLFEQNKSKGVVQSNLGVKVRKLLRYIIHGVLKKLIITSDNDLSTLKEMR